GAHLGATCDQCSNEFAVLTQRSVQKGAKLACGTQRWKVVLCGADVRHMESPMLAEPTKFRIIDANLGSATRPRAKMSPRNHCAPFLEAQQHIIDPANPGGALDDGVEDWLHVRGRAADNAEHFGGRGLMLQGLAQFSVALLDFLEQPHVFYCDHRLVGEGFEQFDLLFRERTDLHTINANHPNGDTLAHERSCKGCAKTNLLLISLHFWIFGIDLCCEVMNVNRPAVDNGSAADKTTANGTTLRGRYCPI